MPSSSNSKSRSNKRPARFTSDSSVNVPVTSNTAKNGGGADTRDGAKPSNAGAGSTSKDGSMFQFMYSALRIVVILMFFRYFILRAFHIRMHAINEYGYVIHEFDPWFNYRATEYLHLNGWKAFANWFDYKVWYPLGRPVGTTIYPGMQVTAVFLKEYVMTGYSLNDICCLIPAIFGCVATVLTGLLAYECSYSTAKGYYSNAEVFVASMACMSIVPAHLMRSVGGGYDNESIAVSAMLLTFYFWVRSLRPGRYNHYFAFATGLAYFYMVAAWGGYVFVINMIGMHAGLLVLMGRFDAQVYKAFTIFYIVGTTLAVQVPVVGWTPLKSLEQLSVLAVFGGYQLIQLSNFIIQKQRTEFNKQNKSIPKYFEWKIRILVFSCAAVLALMGSAIMLPKGYFGPISSRVRGLFVKHTKTGNPLVDSVAEHQPASKSAYFTYLSGLCGVAPLGFIVVLTRSFSDNRSSFLCLYGLVTYFFSSKMVRLILLTGPVASALSGIFIGRILGWACSEVLPFAKPAQETSSSAEKKKAKKQSKRNNSSEESGGESIISRVFYVLNINPESNEFKGVKKIIAILCFVFVTLSWNQFAAYCDGMSHALSNPSIMFKGRASNGQEVLVDDYREAYNWLRRSTPEDSRILAWWDYGYQITGISNRTTIADGNTWNHEHIALLGMILTGPEKQSHRIMRHLADYVLVWAGGGGDDLAKSPHLARIANSVYRNHCPNDPTCRAFGFRDRQGTPSPMMQKSLLYKLHSHNIRPGVEADPNRFKEVFKSKYGKVRIFKILGVSKESKAWVANPANKLCDVQGSWYCPGQYPPALEPVLKSKTDFAQLEDFNKGRTDDEYQKQYFENLKNPKKAFEKAQVAEREAEKAMKIDKDEVKDLLKARIEERKTQWVDDEETTHMWNLINTNDVTKVKEWLKRDPSAAHMRSADGRGPMWWAYEERNMEIVKELMAHGVSFKDPDKYGKTPLDMLTDRPEL